MKFIKEAYLKGILKKENDVKFTNFDGCENKLREESVGETIQDLPAIFERVWGPIRKEKFQMLLKNPSWLNIEVSICERCYIMFTDSN